MSNRKKTIITTSLVAGYSIFQHLIFIEFSYTEILYSTLRAGLFCFLIAPIINYIWWGDNNAESNIRH